MLNVTNYSLHPTNDIFVVNETNNDVDEKIELLYIISMLLRLDAKSLYEQGELIFFLKDSILFFI